MLTQKKDIYLVEDSPDFRHLVRSIFKKFLPDYSIRFFQGGNELYQFMVLQSGENYTGSHPGLIIMDLDLPVINGYDMIRLVKQTPPNSATTWEKIPIVVLSNHATQADINRCYQAGINSFFIKPVEFDALHSLLATICRYWIDYNHPASPDVISYQKERD